ncbi:MAG TPA: amino acid ABC transporter substrate-binding protein [Burkholderiaceae bacterium]|nr:amino acid ABC transporter substrate-binding protein [Burkholderiaceae bacterium]
MLRRSTVTLALLLAPLLGHAQALEGALKKIKSSKTVAVAYRSDAAPFSFVDDSKQPSGFSIDLCRRVVASIGQQLAVDGMQIQWVPVSVQDRMDAVEKRRADMECGSTSVTLGRSKRVNFSSYIFVDGTSMLMRASANIRQLVDLGGKKIGVIPGTTNEKALNDALKRQVITATVVPLASRDEGLAQLEGGHIDVFVSDRTLLLALAPKAKDPRALSLSLDDLSFEPYAIVLPRGDDDLRLAVNTALAQIYRSGDITAIFNRWFGAMGKPGGMLQATYILGAIPE